MKFLIKKISASSGNPHVSTAIPGATKKEQLLEKLKSLDVVEKLNK